jgi:hypothetical protein
VGVSEIAREYARNLGSGKMPFQTDERLETDVRKAFGAYIMTFTSRSGQVRADLFRTGRVVVAHVSFPSGLDASNVSDPYVSELWNYAREQGIADNFKVVLS